MSDKGYLVIGVPRQQNTDLLITAISGFITPVKGTITGVYGSQRILNGQPRSPHRGVDIAATRGTPVVSLFESRYYLLGDIRSVHISLDNRFSQ